MRDCVCLVYDDDMDHGLVLVEFIATTCFKGACESDVTVIVVVVLMVLMTL